MGLIEAYSKEQKRVMDAEEAYEEFWLGNLKNQNSFECTGDNCTAIVTCACMYIPEKELKKSPYFTIHDKKHSKDCSYFQGLSKIDYEKESGVAIGTTKTKSHEMKFNFSSKPLDDSSGEKEPPIRKKQTEHTKGKTLGFNNGENLRIVNDLRAVVTKWKTIMSPFFKTSKTSFLIPPFYDTDGNSFSPLESKLFIA